jgi:pimeloyl-ACP methyl ester carboxylesterase
VPAAPDHPTPSRTVVFLHGIFGRGNNWEGFARRLIAARPEWSAVLVDLRMHGESQGFPPPHTLRAAAADVREVLAELVASGEREHAIVGHSFGGKVALSLLADSALADSVPAESVREAWVLDASPSARAARGENDSTRRVLTALFDAPPRFATRAAFVAELQRAGVDTSLGQWLSKNLIREPDGLRLVLDLQAIADLLADHDRSDVWSAIEVPEGSSSQRDIKLRFVLGGLSPTVSAADRARLREAAARRPLEIFDLPTAGHWVHVDDPEGLMRALIERLGR